MTTTTAPARANEPQAAGQPATDVHAERIRSAIEAATEHSNLADQWVYDLVDSLWDQAAECDSEHCPHKAAYQAAREAMVDRLLERVDGHICDALAKDSLAELLAYASQHPEAPMTQAKVEATR